MRPIPLHGLIRRRVLVNYRLDPEVAARHVPAPFRPKNYYGHAIAGICLVRLEHVRPAWMPGPWGVTSENAAHRIAVEWDDEITGQPRDGVYIPQRHTNSPLTRLGGGRFVSTVHHQADFTVVDTDSRVNVSMRAPDSGASLELRALESSFHPATSCFRRLADASTFFEHASREYSATGNPQEFDAVDLHIKKWHVLPLAVEHVNSSYFADESRFPHGSATFDHALILRDTEIEWRAASPTVGRG
jgi:hypothetical protein